jgi:hypothetical protein
MTYLSGRDAIPKQKNALKNARSAEGQVFERLAKQAEIFHNIQK